ncbi:carotenoid 9,10(9',10')-cleavage dioxygenase 1-like isoform X2 [Rhodamnia argentea]|uniref:Carotenoid 9,10(9',10')-cleavage dioxygenase 1-like isoform X2 n=1 Tax=Rhodamnia argentea TaxID=178133 RepID=A0A8B8P9S0_9MYRT|nr:carotenoid 9,10(9',10')-cleavage dioxygenase 1-like isoform X2 [Rhodamnia argentea]
MALSSHALHVTASLHKPSISQSRSFDRLKLSVPLDQKPLWKVRLPQKPWPEHVLEALKSTSRKMLEAFVDSVFRFVDQPLLPSQKNFAPVEEIGEAIVVACCEGDIPVNFPQGVLVRNGPNPLFGGLKSTESIFGRSSQTWVEGEGMLHAVYFEKGSGGNWLLSYKNRYVESDTFKLEKPQNKPSFLPALEGDSWAIMAAYLLNTLRYGAVNKYMSNTNVLEHAGKTYTVAENYVPQEVDIVTLEAGGDWNFGGEWDQPFTSHPKRAPESGELVTMGINAARPYYAVGVISADGKKLNHKADLEFDRSILSHEIGVTHKYNVIIDHPLVFDMKRLLNGGPLLKYDKEGYARIGVMPRYGDASSVRWFYVESSCTFHMFNSFEDGDEVVVRGCRALTAVFPGPDWGTNKFDWFSRGFDFREPVAANANKHRGYLFTRAHEWRLNMETGEVQESNLTGTEFSVDFPFINADFTGLPNKYGYAQVINSKSSSECGMAKYGGLVKLYVGEPCPRLSDSEGGGDRDYSIKVEYHNFEKDSFCSGSIFVPKKDGVGEDSGWIVSWVHNEETDVSQVHVIDAQKFEGEPVAKITLPQRVPYGFHGTFVSTPN